MSDDEYTSKSQNILAYYNDNTEASIYRSMAWVLDRGGKVDTNNDESLNFRIVYEWRGEKHTQHVIPSVWVVFYPKTGVFTILSIEDFEEMYDPAPQLPAPLNFHSR